MLDLEDVMALPLCDGTFGWGLYAYKERKIHADIRDSSHINVASANCISGDERLQHRGGLAGVPRKQRYLCVQPKSFS